jgi:hypothetical protein
VNATKTGKWMERKRRKKKKDPAKKGGWDKTKFFGKFGARETRPMSTTKKALRVALRATSTSGKVLHDEPSTTNALI